MQADVLHAATVAPFLKLEPGSTVDFVQLPASSRGVGVYTPTALAEPGIGRLVRALEDTWAGFGVLFGVAPAVIVIGSGSTRRHGLQKLGHFERARWLQAGRTTLRAEVMLAGEMLIEAAEDIFETLLHEAVHALAVVRGVEDTSKNGRYHNQAFAELAAELGLIADYQKGDGYAQTALTPRAVERHKRAIAAIAMAQEAAGFTFRLQDDERFHQLESVRQGVTHDAHDAPLHDQPAPQDFSPPSPRPARRSRRTLVCECPRRIMIAEGQVGRGRGVQCLDCQTVFRPEDGGGL